MKELITVAASFLIIVALAFYMYVNTQKNSIAIMKSNELQELVKSNQEELKAEILALRLHIAETDSIFHSKAQR